MLTIGQLARRAGVGVETIRFYEREGLLAEPCRLPSGYRQYSPDAVDRVHFLRRAHRVGFTLAEAKELLALRDDSDADRAVVCERARGKMTDIDARLADLQSIRAELVRLLALRPGGESADGCPIVTAIGDERPT